MWRLYHDLLALRRAHPALSVGDWLPIECAGNLLAYERRHGDERLLVVLNLGDAAESFAIPEWAEGLSVLLATGTGDDPAVLGPNEGYILG
jgi:alpha-glucosidase